MTSIKKNVIPLIIFIKKETRGHKPLKSTKYHFVKSFLNFAVTSLKSILDFENISIQIYLVIFSNPFCCYVIFKVKFSRKKALG